MLRALTASSSFWMERGALLGPQPDECRAGRILPVTLVKSAFAVKFILKHPLQAQLNYHDLDIGVHMDCGQCRESERYRTDNIVAGGESVFVAQGVPP